MKQFFLLIAILLAVVPAAAHQPDGRPTVAVVLSGGGAKGVAHISALRAIEEAGIPVDIVCGTSMGSLIGALYCVGYSPDQLDSIVRSLDLTALFTDRISPRELSLIQRQEQNTYAFIRSFNSERTAKGGLIRGRNIESLFRRLCHNYPDSIDFDKLPIRFACVATDVVTYTEVDFHSGFLATAMRASMAIPGVFTPVRIGDSVLVDGGLTNNYPADVARAMGADIIIGVSVQNDLQTADDAFGAISVFNQIIDINTKGKYAENVAITDVMMKVDVSGYSAASFSPAAIDSLLLRGSAEAARHRDDLLAIHARIQGSAPDSATTIPVQPSIGYSPSYTRPSHDQRRKTAAQRHAAPIGHIGSSPIVSVGFRFDSEDMGSLLVNYKTPLRSRLPLGFSATARLGRRFAANSQLILLPRSFTSSTLSASFLQSELDIYTAGIRSHNTKYRQYSADLSPFNFKFRNFNITIGLRWDFFDFYDRILSYDTSQYNSVDTKFFSYHISADLNTEDNWYFPTRGTRLHFNSFYRTDDFVGYDNKVGILEATLHARTNLSLHPRFSIQPSLYSRLVFHDDVPLPLLNAVGGYWPGHFVDQQIPVPGVGKLELVSALFSSFQLQAQQRILNNHYVILGGAFSIHNNSFDSPLTPNSFWGVHAGYSYNTPAGPVDVRIGYNSLSGTEQSFIKRINFFLNIGHHF